MTINAFFIIYKGAKGLGLHKTPIGIAIGSAFGIGFVFAVISIPFTKIKNIIENKFNNGDLELTDVSVENEK